MRKFITIIKIIIISLLSFSLVNAQNNNKLQDLDEFLKFNINLLNEVISSEEIDSLNVKSAIKMYYFNEHDFFIDYKDNNSFSDLISKDYVYHLPTIKNNTIIIKSENNKFEILGTILKSSLKQNNDINRLEVKNVIDKNNLNINKEGIIFITSQKHYLNLAYFKDITNEEYVVVYAARPEFIGIENGEVLKAKDFLEISKANLFEEVIADGVSGSSSNIKAINYNYVILKVSFIFIIFLVIKYRKKLIV